MLDLEEKIEKRFNKVDDSLNIINNSIKDLKVIAIEIKESIRNMTLLNLVKIQTPDVTFHTKKL